MTMMVLISSVFGLLVQLGLFCFLLILFVSVLTPSSFLFSSSQNNLACSGVTLSEPQLVPHTSSK